MIDNKIALVVGHNKISSGAVGDAGLSEFEFNKTLASDIYDIFSNTPFKNNFKIFYRDNVKIPYTHLMYRLHNDIDEWGADIALELHFNASKNKSVDGHEVLYNKSSGRVAKRLAKVLNDDFTVLLNNRNRGVKSISKGGRGSSFLRLGKSINIIAEPFFASHQSMYMNKSEQDYQNLLGAYMSFLLKALRYKV